MTSILFTGGGGAGNEALWSLLCHKYDLHFCDADRFAIDPLIPPNRRHQIPFASEPSFLVELGHLCESLAIDLLVPGVDEELPLLAREPRIFWPTRIMVPALAYVETMLDKLAMVRGLNDRGVRVPETRRLTDDLADMIFPCVCKPRSGRGSRNVSVLQTRQDAAALQAKLGPTAATMLVQEKIEGTEYTVQVSADANGILRAIVPVKVDIKRGITLRASTDFEPRVISACETIHAAMTASGCYNVQLILTPDGVAVPFEINPRISTTLCLVVASGVDPFSNFLGQLTNVELQPFEAGLRLQRHWRNHFVRASEGEADPDAEGPSDDIQTAVQS